MNRDEYSHTAQAQPKTQKKNDLQQRLKEYALRIIRLYDEFPARGAAQHIAHQLLRSGTSPGAHYAEACRAKSDADFVSKIEGGLQELQESLFWLDLLVEGRFVPKRKLDPLRDETDQLISIFVTIVNKVKAKRSRSRR